jgi:hypothetical protein
MTNAILYEQLQNHIAGCVASVPGGKIQFAQRVIIAKRKCCEQIWENLPDGEESGIVVSGKEFLILEPELGGRDPGIADDGDAESLDGNEADGDLGLRSETARPRDRSPRNEGRELEWFGEGVKYHQRDDATRLDICFGCYCRRTEENGQERESNVGEVAHDRKDEQEDV